jgi:cyclic-di-GMP phosphodiesterase, flagellum assembly factor TipF
LRPEGASATGGATPTQPQEANGPVNPAPVDAAAINPQRATGNAALARRAVGPG